MGNAAGELADRFHFLRLPEGLFGLTALGELDGLWDDRDHLALFAAHGAHLEVEPAPPANRKLGMHLLAHGFSASDRGNRPT